MKLRVAKTILFFFCGAGLTVATFRLIHGLGSVVALTDLLPWGLWKGGGVVALVPVGGAGFTLAGLVYIFHVERFKPLARGAVLLGLMCYSSVALGLSLDIGISWRIVYPVIFWQFHSTLFEIAWCIMLYLGVLALEFSHAVLERYDFPRTSAIVEKGSLIFVIAGISLSTLHQSSLGTLFLATPYRLHPLWYTDFLPLFFFITSIGLGCLTITWLTLALFWLFDAKKPMNALTGLAHIAFYFFIGYGLLKFGEIILSGEGGLLFSNSAMTVNFWIEIILSVFIPIIFLARKGDRENPALLFWVSTAVIVGISLNRVNVAGLATVTLMKSSYFPAITEWIITFGILSGAGLVFLFFVERFKVFTEIDEHVVTQAYAVEHVDQNRWYSVLFRNPLAEVQLYTAVFIVAIALSVGFLPDTVIYGVEPDKVPTSDSRIVEMFKSSDINAVSFRYTVFAAEQTEKNDSLLYVLMIDGNQDGDYVIFDHDLHIKNQGNEKSCNRCHHMNVPYEKASRCTVCHQDMYRETTIFDHEFHVRKNGEKVGENRTCELCHTDNSKPKTVENTKACTACHRNFLHDDALIKLENKQHPITASSYMNAMHGLCITCHRNEKEKLKTPNENFDRCTQCHRELPSVDSKVWEHTL